MSKKAQNCLPNYDQQQLHLNLMQYISLMCNVYEYLQIKNKLALHKSDITRKRDRRALALDTHVLNSYHSKDCVGVKILEMKNNIN